MRLLVGGMAALLCFATTIGCLSSKDESVAGRSYTENEDGELVLNDGKRKTGSTPPPKNSDVPWLSEFELTERSGQKVSSDDLRGQPYVVSFFFSLCPSICVQQNEKVQSMQMRFAGKPVRFVSITCDPEVDQPAVLAEYADRFKADKDQWLFLTGDLNYLRRVGAEIFSLPVDRRFHAEKFVLVDAEGKIAGFYTWTDDVQWQGLQTDVGKMIANGGFLPKDAAQAGGSKPTSDEQDAAPEAAEAAGISAAAEL